jgi:hypothetical protein
MGKFCDADRQAPALEKCIVYHCLMMEHGSHAKKPINSGCSAVFEAIYIISTLS